MGRTPVLPTGTGVSGTINLKEGGLQGVKGPTSVGTGKAKDKNAPPSEIIEILNERFGTQFTEEDRLSFPADQGKSLQ